MSHRNKKFLNVTFFTLILRRYWEVLRSDEYSVLDCFARSFSSGIFLKNVYELQGKLFKNLLQTWFSLKEFLWLHNGDLDCLKISKRRSTEPYILTFMEVPMKILNIPILFWNNYSSFFVLQPLLCIYMPDQLELFSELSISSTKLFHVH